VKLVTNAAPKQSASGPLEDRFLSATSNSAVERRAETLDTIAAVLPMNRRDMLTDVLTDEDVETLRHLVNEGMGENTLRGYCNVNLREVALGHCAL